MVLIQIGGGGGSGVSTSIICTGEFVAQQNTSNQYMGISSGGLRTDYDERKSIIPNDCTFKKLKADIHANTDTAAKDFGIWHNTAKSALIITIPALTTGDMENVATSLSLTEDDTAALGIEGITSTKRIDIRSVSFICEVA